MRVRLIRKETIEDFVVGHARSKPSFGTFTSLIKGADWEIPLDIIETFNTADILGSSSDRVCFNIGGNNFRMICKYLYGRKRVSLFICWIGTHAEYTTLCNDGDQYTINNY